jgi:hypothetical protein
LQEAHPVQAVQIVGTKFILAAGYIGEDAAATYPIVYADKQSIVHQNTRPLPRAFAVHQALPAKGPDDALAYFKNLELDPQKTVIIEAESLIPLPSPATGSTATVVNQNPQLVEVETSLTGDGYLVLLDTYYPGWTASVDGQDTPIYRANYIGRAVFVPAGEHLVRFDYRPWSFNLGLGLSILAWLVIVIVGLSRVKKVRPSQ